MSRPGQEKYCKLCASVYLPQINERLRRGDNAGQIARFVRELSASKFTFTRQTLYAHRDNRGGYHILGVDEAKEKVESRPEEKGEVRPVTNDRFLERIRDLAFKQNLEDPDAHVDLKTGLAAVKILEERKNPKIKTLVLAQVFTGQLPQQSSDVIEGEFRELPATPAQIEEKQ